MGFLKRRRVKRLVKTRSGRTCYRGFEYKYSISRQDWNYLKYLANPEKASREEDTGVAEGAITTVDIIMLQFIKKTAPKEAWADLWRTWRRTASKIASRKGYRRFSTTKFNLQRELVDKSSTLVEDGFISFSASILRGGFPRVRGMLTTSSLK
ncbi:MAG: hypothetical protein OWQ48_00180 [Desulfurococcus sp.]|nr:hypothetical protein [Desulfurococcus sp.]